MRGAEGGFRCHRTAITAVASKHHRNGRGFHQPRQIIIDRVASGFASHAWSQRVSDLIALNTITSVENFGHRFECATASSKTSRTLWRVCGSHAGRTIEHQGQHWWLIFDCGFKANRIRQHHDQHHHAQRTQRRWPGWTAISQPRGSTNSQG